MSVKADRVWPAAPVHPQQSGATGRLALTPRHSRWRVFFKYKRVGQKPTNTHTLNHSRGAVLHLVSWLSLWHWLNIILGAHVWVRLHSICKNSLWWRIYNCDMTLASWVYSLGFQDSHHQCAVFVFLCVVHSVHLISLCSVFLSSRHQFSGIYLQYLFHQTFILHLIIFSSPVILCVKWWKTCHTVNSDILWFLIYPTSTSSIFVVLWDNRHI